MEGGSRRKRSLMDNNTNKENECSLERHVQAACNKDARQRLAQQQLNDISEIDWRRVDANWNQQPDWEDISGWNQQPRAGQLKPRINNFRSSSELKPQSAGRCRPLSTSKHEKPSNRAARMNYRTSTLQTIGDDEVLVCKPIATEPAEQYQPTNNESNILFEHKPVNSVVGSNQAVGKCKTRDEPNKLYDIIKSIEMENGKLLRKLFKEKSMFREVNISQTNRKQSLKSAGRPRSGVRRQRSKDSFKAGQQLPSSKTDQLFNFVLCNQKGVMPSTVKQARPDIRTLRQQLFQQDDKSIFYPCGNVASRFALRTKLAAGSIVTRKK